MNSLKEFVNRFESRNLSEDINILIEWIRENHLESKMIGRVGELAESIMYRSGAYESRVKEWATYAYLSGMPPINEDLDFAKAINRLRIAYLAFDDEGFVKSMDELLRIPALDLEYISSLHPEISERYERCQDASKK